MHIGKEATEISVMYKWQNMIKLTHISIVQWNAEKHALLIDNKYWMGGKV